MNIYLPLIPVSASIHDDVKFVYGGWYTKCPLSDAVKSPPPKTCFPLNITNTPATSVRNQTRGLDMIVDYHKTPTNPSQQMCIPGPAHDSC